MHRWKSTSRQVRGSFFFHYRGTALQKSFEGLLRGIIRQLLMAEPALLSVLRSTLDDIYNRETHLERLGSLETDLYRLMATAKCPERRALDDDIQSIVTSQDALSSLRRALVSLLHSDYVGGFEFVEADLPRRRDDRLKQGRRPRRRTSRAASAGACLSTAPPRLCARKISGFAVGDDQPQLLKTATREMARSGTDWNDVLGNNFVS